MNRIGADRAKLGGNEDDTWLGKAPNQHEMECGQSRLLDIITGKEALKDKQQRRLWAVVLILEESWQFQERDEVDLRRLKCRRAKPVLLCLQLMRAM
jgi:hypothetical protein